MKPRASQYDILIACECSGAVRDAFIAQGLRAISCDLKPTRAPGPHYCGDVRDILGQPWLAMIAHPDCTYLSNSGNKHLYNGWKKENGRNAERWAQMRKGAAFFRLLDQANHIPLRAIENPIMHGHGIKEVGRKATQFIQPWWFGAPFKKATGLWLTGLPPLVREYNLAWYGARGIEVREKVFKMGPSPERQELRSNTEPQVARALAQYWAPVIRAAIALPLAA